MFNWIEEQILIFLESKAPYILIISTILAFILLFTSNNYRDEFYKTSNDNLSKKLEYKVKAKHTRRATKIVFIGGIVLAFYSFRRKKKFYDNW